MHIRVLVLVMDKQDCVVGLHTGYERKFNNPVGTPCQRGQVPVDETVCLMIQYPRYTGMLFVFNMKYKTNEIIEVAKLLILSF